MQLDLFSFHDVSPGAAFWHPKGWTLYQTLRGAMRELQARRGYQEVYTPPLVHKKLWEQSGHWEHYRDNMFLVEAEEQTFSLKPMNCPESTLHLPRRTRSYRDLPLRLSEYGVLHRSELSGVLSGLTRVRHFVTDDAHIYVRPEQIGAEIEALMGEIRESYGWFGLTPHADLRHAAGQGARRSRRLGARPRRIMRDELERVRPAAIARSPRTAPSTRPRSTSRSRTPSAASGRRRRSRSTGVMLPERFDLWYIDEDGQQQRPVAIHRAIYGSLERFIGVLIEHFAGAFPFWCAPVQAVVVPIADRHVEAGHELAAVLRARGLRVEVDDSSNRMQNKIRLAQEQKVPYMLVLGDREIEARSAAPRTRAGEQQPAEGWEALADRLAAEAADRRP